MSTDVDSCGNIKKEFFSSPPPASGPPLNALLFLDDRPAGTNYFTIIYTEDVSLVGSHTVSYTFSLEAYPGVSVTAAPEEQFVIEVKDPCKSPIITFDPVPTLDQSYTLTQAAVPVPISPFVLNYPWCDHSYAYGTSDDAHIKVLIAFDTAVDPPVFTFLYNEDL